MKVLKKKKLKIDTSRAGGQRMVFDEEGTAMPPLAALAQQRNESGGLTGKTGVYLMFSRKHVFRIMNLSANDTA